METKRNSRLIFLGFIVVLALSAYLRLSGITWGMKSGYGHHLNFHPDEFISIRGMSPISLRTGRLEAPDAYFEGTFNYYLWAVPRMLYDLPSERAPVAAQRVTGSQFQFILLSGRLMSVAFDLATLILLFALIRDLTNQGMPALFGALLYGVFPMQVIYSHFMRTYTLTNFLCVLVIWLSFKALKYHRSWLFVVTGLAAGLTAATRYPAGLVLTVPCALLLFQGHTREEPWRQRVGKFFATPPLWLLVCGFVLGLFVGEPMLFLDFRSVTNAISLQSSLYAPPGAGNPFDLAAVWKYICVLIPYATFPLLSVLLYVSTFYVIQRRSLWPTVVPLCLFGMLYTYAMAKGYLDVFARLTMLLLPVLCIFTGLACGEIFPKITKRSFAFRLAVIMILLISPSVLFDLAYGQAMKGRDVREQLRQDMRELVNNRPATTIGVSSKGAYFYTSMPAVLPLASDNVVVDLAKSLGKPADFLVIGFERPVPEELRDSTIRRLESGGVFRFTKEYTRAPSIFGKTLDWSGFPVDMTYPFPSILLFSKTTDAYKTVGTSDGSRFDDQP